MIIFNGLYKKYPEDSKSEDALFLAMNLCDFFIDSYYNIILQRNFNSFNVEDDIIKFLEENTLTKFFKDETDFYREMDNPQRILLYSCNMIENTNKIYHIIIEPLSGATETGFALKSISNQIGKKVVKDIIPIRYSFYQDKGLIYDFDSLIKNSLASPFISYLPKNKNDPLFILDDNISLGRTLILLQDLFSEKYSNVDISAIEVRTKYYKGLDKNKIIVSSKILDNLTYEPIGETRRNIAIYKFINEYLLKK